MPYVCKFDTEGNLIQCRTGEDSRFQNLACDDVGNLYVTGDRTASLGAFLLKIGNTQPAGSAGIVSQDEDSEDMEAPAEWLVSFGSSHTEEETRGNSYDPKYRGSSSDYVFDLEIDSAGNLYMACVVHGTIEFDPDQSVDHPPNRPVLLKFLPDGTFDWMKNWVDGVLYSIAIDGEDNIHVAGVAYRCHELDMDPGPGIDLHSDNGLKQGFAVKLDSAGDYVWGRTFGHEDRSLLCDSIAVDGSGNVFVLGNVTSGAVSSRTQLFDIDPIPNQQPHGATFLVKLDPDGNLDWRYHWDGEGAVSAWTRCYGLVADDNGNVYMASSPGHSANLDFDPGPGVQMAGGNGYLLSLDTSGAFRWVWTYSGRVTPDIQALEIGPDGHIFMSGDGGYRPSSPAQGTLGGPFIREFDPNGNIVNECFWTSERHTYSGKAADLAVTQSGEVCFTGCASTMYSEGPATRESPDTRIFTREVLLGMSDPAGNIETTLWGRGKYLDAGRVIECDAEGNIYVGGVAEGIFLMKLKPVDQW